MGNLLKYDFVKEYVESNGYILLDNTYIRSDIQMKMECPKGHIFSMSWKVFRKGHRCSYCAGKRQYNIEEVRNIFEKESYTLLSDNYSSNRDKLRVIGPDNKEYEVTFFGFNTGGSRPHLKGQYGQTEEECRTIFQDITKKNFVKVRPDWLKNPDSGRNLELDGYCEELKMAFEFDGRQHFEHTFKDDDLQDLIKRDEFKAQACRNLGIRLIKISCDIYDIRSFIENELDHPNRFMYLGDPHVTQNNMEESQKLINFVAKELKKNRCNNLVILGDLFHTHGVIQLPVMEFWEKSIKKLLKICRIFIIKGNHDTILGESEFSGLTPITYAYSKSNQYNLIKALEPTLYGNIGFLSYEEDPESFYENANFLYRNGAKVLVCHQTFNGAKYESGIFAPDGLDLERLPFETVISGHIHSRQRFNKLIYPGTAKWDSKSDANEIKGLYIVDHNILTGHVENEVFISTEEVCTPIVGITLKEGQDMPTLPKNARVNIELVGSSDWVQKIKKEFVGKASISSKITDIKKFKERKSGKSLHEFMVRFYNADVKKREKLIAYLEKTGLLEELSFD